MDEVLWDELQSNKQIVRNGKFTMESVSAEEAKGTRGRSSYPVRPSLRQASRFRARIPGLGRSPDPQGVWDNTCHHTRIRIGGVARRGVVSEVIAYPAYRHH